MNREQNESRRRLLNDILGEDPSGLKNHKEAALSAFRRGRLLRRAGRASVAVMIVAVATAALLLQREIPPEAPRSAVGSVPPSESPVNQPDIPRLSDDELIASFPSNSCFLAEVEGRQILVFVDPRVEEDVLRKSKVAFAHNR